MGTGTARDEGRGVCAVPATARGGALGALKSEPLRGGRAFARFARSTSPCGWVGHPSATLHSRTAELCTVPRIGGMPLVRKVLPRGCSARVGPHSGRNAAGGRAGCLVFLGWSPIAPEEIFAWL